MAFISQAGGAGGLPRNPYPRVAPPRPNSIPQPGALGTALAPPTFNMPPPIDPTGFGAQAAAETQRQIDPILQQIAARSNAQAQYSSQAISALTNVYASRLGGLADMAKSTYAPEIKTSKATGTSLNHYLTGAGQAAAATESNATGLQGMSAGSDVPLAAEGAGAGNAAEAIQAGMTQALKTAQSAAVKYAGSLPGFAQAEGAQIKNDTLKQLAAVMAQQLADVTAQAPTLYHQLYNEFLDRAESDRNFKLDMAKLQYSIDSDNYDRQASIVGPKAPTTQGKLAYWTKIAQERTASDPEGRQWFADPNGNGINFRKGPNGQPVHSKEWIDNQAEVIIRTHSTSTGALTPRGVAMLKAIGYTKFAGTGADPKITSKIQLQKIKSAEAVVKLQQQQKIATDKLNATIAHNKAMEANTRASTAQRKAASERNAHLTQQQQAIQKANNLTKATGIVHIASGTTVKKLIGPDGKPVKAKAAATKPATDSVTTSTTTKTGRTSTTTSTTRHVPKGTAPKAPKAPPKKPTGLGPQDIPKNTKTSFRPKRRRRLPRLDRA